MKTLILAALLVGVSIVVVYFILSENPPGITSDKAANKATNKAANETTNQVIDNASSNNGNTSGNSSRSKYVVRSDVRTGMASPMVRNEGYRVQNIQECIDLAEEKQPFLANYQDLPKDKSAEKIKGPNCSLIYNNNKSDEIFLSCLSDHAGWSTISKIGAPYTQYGQCPERELAVCGWKETRDGRDLNKCPIWGRPPISRKYTSKSVMECARDCFSNSTVTALSYENKDNQDNCMCHDSFEWGSGCANPVEPPADLENTTFMYDTNSAGELPDKLDETFPACGYFTCKTEEVDEREMNVGDGEEYISTEKYCKVADQYCGKPVEDDMCANIRTTGGCKCDKHFKCGAPADCS